MEWHPDDPMDFRDALAWYMCQSNVRRIRFYGYDAWDRHTWFDRAMICYRRKAIARKRKPTMTKLP